MIINEYISLKTKEFYKIIYWLKKIETTHICVVFYFAMN